MKASSPRGNYSPAKAVEDRAATAKSALDNMSKRSEGSNKVKQTSNYSDDERLKVFGSWLCSVPLHQN